jgi:hypothetical protein
MVYPSILAICFMATAILTIRDPMDCWEVQPIRFPTEAITPITRCLMAFQILQLLLLLSIRNLTTVAGMECPIVQPTPDWVRGLLTTVAGME